MEKVSEFEQFVRAGRYNLCAILYNNTSILAVGYNDYCPHTYIFRKKLSFPSVHAEIDAIKQYIDTCKKPTKKRVKAHMMVLRKNINNEFVTSKPCKHCIEMLKSFKIEQFINIKNITYFDGNEFVTELLNDIKNNHVSSGWRHYY